jgi:hypothetical protein
MTTRSRDDVIADLADAIVTATFVHPRLSLLTILESRDEAPLISHEDTVRLIQGDREVRLDILDRVENDASNVVRNWLENTPRGRTLVDETMSLEREAAIEEEL